MADVLEFLLEHEDGVTEDALCAKFPLLKKVDLAKQLNNLLQAKQIEVLNDNGSTIYRAVQNKTADYEALVIALLAKHGSSGLWLRDIKIKTNIPHNLILKILKNLEANRKIKSVKSVKNNRRMYMLYDVKPDDEVTGGVWFSNNDVDLVFVNQLMEIIYKYCHKKVTPFSLHKLDTLVRMTDLMEFLCNSKITDIKLTLNDINTLIDCLIFDGRMERLVLEDGIALRTIDDGYLMF